GNDEFYYSSESDLANDTVRGDAGDDTVEMGVVSGHDLVLDGGVSSPVFESIENIVLGGNGNNSLTINTAFFAANGVDTLNVSDTDQGISFTVNGGTQTAGQHLHITSNGNGIAALTGGDGNNTIH